MFSGVCPEVPDGSPPRKLLCEAYGVCPDAWCAPSPLHFPDGHLPFYTFPDCAIGVNRRYVRRYVPDNYGYSIDFPID